MLLKKKTRCIVFIWRSYIAVYTAQMYIICHCFICLFLLEKLISAYLMLYKPKL